MAKIEWLQRLLLFVHKLENGPKYVSSKELLHYLETNLQLRYGDIPGNSLRTIQRDIKAIDELFGIEIKYQKGLGYYIAEEYWGKGIMTEAIKQICQHVFQKSDIIRIYAEPFAYNIASCRALEKAGFQYEGTLRNNAVKNGKVIDMKMYSILNTEL